MRILVLTNLYPPHYLGGYELICEAVATALRSRGHEVSILTSNHVCDGVERRADQAVERSLRIHGLYGHPWLSIPSLWRLELHNNRTLENCIQCFKPDLVYVWNMGGLSKSMLFTLERLGVPVAFYVSDHWIARAAEADVWLRWWNCADGSIRRRLSRAVASSMGLRGFVSRTAPTKQFNRHRFRRVYFCSRALRKLTASAGLDVMHGSVIYCPVDISRFTGIPKSESEPLCRFLWVGRLAPDKGILTALKAIKRIDQKFSFSLNVYGFGAPGYVAELEHFVTENKLPVEFRLASAPDMPAVYRAHDALLFTSEWAEPFALTPLEAMATGLPVIGTMTGGSREIFRHKVNSLTYTAGNAEELAERILELASDSALRVRIAAAGQAEVRNNYSEPIIVNQIEQFLTETISNWRNSVGGSSDKNIEQTLTNTPFQRVVHLQGSELNRFTLDGSDALESSLCDLTAQAVAGVRSCIPSKCLEGLLLGGGYGRGEGGVLRTKTGDRPYNDLEFYVLIRGPIWLSEKRHRAPLHRLAERLSNAVGIEVEFKILSLQKLRSSSVTMFYYDLISGHKLLLGDKHLLDECQHHRAGHRIPLYECTRLLMNRCSGLLYSIDRLQERSFSTADADFVGRNLAKAQLAFGDILLAANGQYHWSCRERHRRLPKLLDEMDTPWVEQILLEHTEGLAFKLHPQFDSAPQSQLFERHASLSELGRKLWLWLENRRLQSNFTNTSDYSFGEQNKCPEVPTLKGRAVSANVFGWRSLIEAKSCRYPRERLLNTLPLLLWHSEATREKAVSEFIQKQLRTSANDFHRWVIAYQNIWNRFN